MYSERLGNTMMIAWCIVKGKGWRTGAGVGCIELRLTIDTYDGSTISSSQCDFREDLEVLNVN